MANKPLVLFLNDEYKKASSNTLDIDFLTVNGRTIATDGAALDSHIASTSNPHSVTKTQVGLGNVDNIQQLPLSYLDTDAGLVANSDSKVPSQKAVKAYVDAATGGLAEFSDSAFRVKDNGDATKKMAFEVSGVATATTRTVTMPDANVNLGHIANLQSLSGVSAGANSLGTFSGAIIPDSSTIKDALQSLETKIENLPDPMEYKGSWNASTNSPALADGTGNNGDVYQVTVAGSQFSPAIAFDIGDKVVYSGATGKWEKWDMTDAVSSVNGATGAVTVNAINELTGDVTAGPATGSQAKAATIAALAVTNAKIANDTITNAKINSAAAIAYSKLALTSSIVNADIAAAAAIAYSKLALSGSIVNSDISASAAIAYSKLALSASIVNADIAVGAAIAYAKLNLSASIVNADIATGAAIAYSKLALSNSIVAGDLTTDAVTTAKIQNGAVDANKLAASVAGNGLSGGGGSALAVNVGDGIKIVSDNVVRDDALSFTNDNAGAITARQVVYVKSNGNVDLAYDATSALGVKMIGLVEDASIASAASGKIVVRDGAVVGGFSALTPGAPVYMGSTAGATTQTAPTAAGTAVYRLGMAISATQIKFKPEFVISNA